MQDIICSDCGATRHRAQYKNTLYCHSCRLLRDLMFVGDRKHVCAAATCRKTFAPVARRDAHCGGCGYGSVYTGTCGFCNKDDVELHRSGVPLCTHCVRDPRQRRRILSSLKRGQADRRTANNHGRAAS